MGLSNGSIARIFTRHHHGVPVLSQKPQQIATAYGGSCH